MVSPAPRFGWASARASRVLLAACALVAAGAFGAASAPGARAQQPGFPGATVPSAPLTPQGLPLATPRLPADALVLEGALDPSAYVVGPGDVFAVSIGGSLPRQVTATVSADGTLVIPEAGSFRAAGRSLAAVRAEAGAALQRRYANVVTDVALAAPRQFYVHVAGAVPRPGRHAVRAVARVEDAVALAGGVPSALALASYGRPDPRRPETAPEARPALRNVTVRHAAGGETRVDLMRYFATGDVRYNPTLRDGDALTVPTFDPVREGAFVGGLVARPGVYDVRPGDTVLDLLEVAAGEAGLRQIGRVRVTRARGATGAGLVEAPIAEAGALRVGPRDQVFAVETDPEAGAAEVVGAVAFPGLYPVRSGETTLAELVRMAGGLDAEALPRGAYLERPRRALPAEAEAEDEAGGPGPLADLDLFSRQFLAAEAARTPRVALDLTAALAGGPPVLIRNGDRLVIPRDVGGVRVFGQVRQPGYVPFVPGQAPEAYVEAAGGRGPGATSAYVVEAGSGRLAPAAGAPVQVGDAVFVDRRPTAEDPALAQLALQERADARAERADARQARFQTAQTAFTAIGTAISLLIAVVALTTN